MNKSTVAALRGGRSDGAAPLPPRSRHCRNCGAVAPGNYCAECGQETRVALPTMKVFMREATGRLVSFDSRLWRTLYALAFRPGLLTKVYLAGRRRHYVRPARLFLAMSLILFAVIRLEVGSVSLGDAVVIDKSDTMKSKPAVDAKVNANDDKASGSVAGLQIGMDDDMNLVVSGAANTFLGTALQQRFDRFNHLSPKEKAEQILDGALRYGSYVIFLLLPVFAGLQYLSYVGRGDRYPGRPRLYAEHLIYAAHLHTFWFLVVIAAVVVPWKPVQDALAVWFVFYAVRSKRAVYGGSWWGSLVRSLFVVVAYFIVVIAALFGLVFASVLLR
jgi:hypothetical protein